MKKEISKFIGQKIKYYRKRMGLTQKELGLKIGVKHNTVSSYEAGTNEPEQNTLFALANVLGVSINDFFPDTEPNGESYIGEPKATYQVDRSTEYSYFPTSVSAGIPTDVEAVDLENVEQIRINDSLMGKWAGSKDIFVIKVNGESMNNVMPDRSIIAVKPIEITSLKDNDIVVFSDDNEYSVKRIIFDRENGRVIFRPDSKDNRFTDYVVENSEVANLKIYGKVVLYIVELD